MSLSFGLVNKFKFWHDIRGVLLVRQSTSCNMLNIGFLFRYFRLCLATGVLICLVMSVAWSQTIKLRAPMSGTFTKGSTISILFDFEKQAPFQIENVFSLYLSDAHGDFTNETKIGETEGFYAAFVNGQIPVSMSAGDHYRLRIKSSLPEAISDISAAFSIAEGAAVRADISSLSIGGKAEMFGLCSGLSEQVFYITNGSTEGATVDVRFTNEATGQAAESLHFISGLATQSFTALQTHYSLFVTARMPDGRMATKAFMLINNRALTAFGTSGENTVSLPDALLQFNVTVSGPDGLNNNYPGNLYIIDWGDGKLSTVTIYDILKDNGRLKHQYEEVSFGHDVYIGRDTIYNAFGITISSINDFCGNIGTPVSTFARVVTTPVNQFFVKQICLNEPAIFENTSDPGLDPYVKGGEQKERLLTYTWLIDGQVVPGAINQPKSFSMEHIFTAPGTYVVRLESNGTGPFSSVIEEQIVCVQAAPIPSFSVNNSENELSICQGQPLSVLNTSQVDASCLPVSYEWSVAGGDGVVLSNSNSKEPDLRFDMPGLFEITLHISTPCGTFSSEKLMVRVDDPVDVQLSDDAVLCNLSSYAFSSSTSGPTRVSGLPDTEGVISWQVQGGAYDFIDGTGPASRFPVIDFKEHTAYTISVM